jgi:hypothetical protein
MPSTMIDRLNGLSTSVAVKAPVKAVATSNVTLSGLQTIGSTACVEGDRVLCVAQSNPVDNGIYDVMPGAWVRSSDFDGGRDVVSGTIVIGPTDGGVALPYDPTSAQIGQLLYPRSAAEITAGVVPVDYRYPVGYVTRYAINSTPGTTDMTYAFTAAASVMAAQGGGTVIIPAGTYGITSVVVTWTGSTSINFAGAGSRATILSKLASASVYSPVMDLSSSPLGDGNYSTFQGFQVIGNSKGGAGIRLTNFARAAFRDVSANTCDVGIECVGALIFSTENCDLNSNNIGLRTRRSGGPYCNLIEIKGGGIRGNTLFAVDIGDTGGFSIANVDIEQNGTAGDANTGGIVLRSTNGLEFGYSVVSLKDVWLEGNYGTSLRTENCANMMLSVVDTIILSAESGRAITSAGLMKCILENIVVAASGDTVSLASGYSSIRNSVINVLTDSSALYDYTNVVTGLTTHHRKSGSSTLGALTINGSKVSSGSGAVATTSAAAATLFTPSIKGMYQVYAYIADAGAAYVANGRFAFDGTNAVRMGGENGANLTLAVGGGNVQATQTSGIAQTVQYVYELVAA